MFIHTTRDTRKTTQRAATAQRRAHNCAQGRAQLAHNSAHNPPLRTKPRNPRLPKGYEHTNTKFRIHMQPAACLNA